MNRLIEIAEWFLIAAGSVVAVGAVIYAALAFRLNHPPRD